MKKYILLASVFIAVIVTACSNRKAEGVMVYNLSYQLPDSVKGYEVYLPKTATVYFKNDSAVTVEGTDAESTTVLTHQPTGYMVSLLKSGLKKFEVQYDAAEQKKELPDMSEYDFIKTTATKTIAGLKAEKYTVKNKFSGDTTSAWFTHDLTVPANFIIMALKPELGVPLIFSTDQNGFITTINFKEIRYEAAPAGTFAIPGGYTKLTPQELREMPAGN